MNSQQVELQKIEIISLVDSHSAFLDNYLRLVNGCTREQALTQEKKGLVDFIKKIIKDPVQQSDKKFLALLLLKQALDYYDHALIEYTKNKMLARLSILALHENKRLPIQDQGKTLFGDGKHPDYSQAFYFLNLECLAHWSTQFGKIARMEKYTKIFLTVEKKLTIRKEPFLLEKLHNNFYFKDYVKLNLHHDSITEKADSRDFFERLQHFIFQVQLKKQPLSIRKSMTPAKMEDLQAQLAMIQQNKNALLEEIHDESHDSNDSLLIQIQQDEYQIDKKRSTIAKTEREIQERHQAIQFLQEQIRQTDQHIQQEKQQVDQEKQNNETLIRKHRELERAHQLLLQRREMHSEQQKETNQLQFMKLQEILAYQQRQVQVHSKDQKFKMVQQKHHTYLRSLEEILAQQIRRIDDSLGLMNKQDKIKQQHHFQLDNIETLKMQVQALTTKIQQSAIKHIIPDKAQKNIIKQNDQEITIQAKEVKMPNRYKSQLTQEQQDQIAQEKLNILKNKAQNISLHCIKNRKQRCPVMPGQEYVQFSEQYKGELENELNNFKIAAIFNKGVLFQNNELQVVYIINQRASSLDGQIIFVNKVRQVQPLRVQFGSLDKMEIKLVKDSGEADTRQYIHADLLENYLQPFQAPWQDKIMRMLLAQVQVSGRTNNLVLPLLINRYFQYQNINENIFRQQPGQFKVQSQRHFVAPFVIQQPNLFMHFLPFLIKLENKDSNVAKYALCFIYKEEKHYMKILFYKYQRKASFQLISQCPGRADHQHVLDVFLFLFCEVEAQNAP